MKNDFFNRELAEKKVLIASHRGVSGGNILENTIPAFQNALLHGADIVEMDCALSTDKKLYVYHTGYEKFHFGLEDRQLDELDSSEIEALHFTNRYFVKVSQGVEKLENAFLFLKGKCLINLDRAYRAPDAALDLIRRLGMQDQVIYKTFVEEELLKHLEEKYPDIMFMPLMGKEKEIEILEKFRLNYVGCELVFRSVEQDIVKRENLAYLKDRYKMLWANPITCEDDLILTGGKNDNLSVTDSFDQGWGWLIDAGFNVLQTDWPALLLRYLKEKGIRD